MSNFALVQIAGKNFKIGNFIQYDDQRYRSFAGLLGSYKNIFCDQLGATDTNDIIQGEIVTSSPLPFYSRSELTESENKILKGIILENLQRGKIRCSKSLYSSPVFIEEKNNKFEMVVNYDRLNSMTIIKTNPVPPVRQVIFSIQESNLFSKIIIKDGYNQIQLDEESKEKTAFLTDFGHFEYNVMVENLKNSEKYFQELIEMVMNDLDENSTKFYQTSILVNTKGFNRHLEILRQLFKNLKSANLKVDLEESCFLYDQIIFLGYLLNHLGISIDPEILIKIINFKKPVSKDELKNFLGLVLPYKIYIPNLDEYARPLYKLISPNTYFFYWTCDEEFVFKKIKKSILFALPVPFKPRKI